MFHLQEINGNNYGYISFITDLHIKSFPNFFLTQLGFGFLKTLYQGYLDDSNSGIIIALDNNKIVGFLAYSFDYPQFFKTLLNNHLISFAFYAMLAAVRHPSYISRLLGAFNKSDSVIKKENYVELASLCVDPQFEGLGIGTALIDYLKGIIDFNKYSYINLETDAENNESVNCFYQKNGFVLERQYVTPEGRLMNEYRYSRGILNG